LRSRGAALLPIMLASFIFDSLVLSGKTSNNCRAENLRIFIQFS
jgi:hypothetical protein